MHGLEKRGEMSFILTIILQMQLFINSLEQGHWISVRLKLWGGSVG
jgi:hypothetical protein